MKPFARSSHAPLCAAFLLAAAIPSPAQETWMRLWNGKDLSGWKHNPAWFKADSGMIVARGASTYNTFCYRPEAYTDFELRFSARLFENMGYANAGVQYRSKADADTVRYGVKGYQLELGQGGYGGFYAEGGYPAGLDYAGPSQACRTATKRNGWNVYRVVADGAKVTHYLNDQKCYELANATVASGIIALQLHQAQGQGVMEVDYKDIYIRPLNKSFIIPDSLAVKLDGTSTLGAPSGARFEALRAASRPGRDFLGRVLDPAGRERISRLPALLPVP